MYRNMKISDVYAGDIFDSYGLHGIEIKVLIGSETVGRAAVPFCWPGIDGSFKDSFRMRRDIRSGVLEITEEINSYLTEALIGRNIFDQLEIDGIICDYFNPDKKRYKTEAVRYGISLAVAKAAAAVLQIPLYRYLGGIHCGKLPLPAVPILKEKRRVRENNNTSGKEILRVVPSETSDFHSGFQLCAEIYHQTAALMEDGEERELSEKLAVAETAAGQSGFLIDRDVCFIWNTEDENGDRDIKSRDVSRCSLFGRTVSIEMLFPSRVGTLTEILLEVRRIQQRGHLILMDLGGLETEETASADVAAAFGADFFSAGVPYGSESTAKYNRMIEIENRLGMPSGILYDS